MVTETVPSPEASLEIEINVSIDSAKVDMLRRDLLPLGVTVPADGRLSLFG